VIITVYNLSYRYSLKLERTLKPPPAAVSVRHTGLFLPKPAPSSALPSDSAVTQLDKSQQESSVIVKELKNTYKKSVENIDILKKSDTSMPVKIELVRHTCNICGRKYLTKKSLREHTKKHFQ
jgi:hypothetical protein